MFTGGIEGDVNAAAECLVNALESLEQSPARSPSRPSPSLPSPQTILSSSIVPLSKAVMEAAKGFFKEMNEVGGGRVLCWRVG